MSFVENNYQQISLNDILFNLTPREKKALEKSWAKDFSERIFPRIDEKKFAVLYSDKASRPNTPVNVVIGALILKELLGMTDEEIVESLMFDIRFQYALHTTSFKEQPLSDKTLSRFRSRCYTYEVMTGIDLVHDCIMELSNEISSIMKITSRMIRLDAWQLISNIKKLSRLELLYTCVSNLVIYMHRQGQDELLEGLEHYYDSGDYNKVITLSRNTDAAARIEKILVDADKLFAICDGDYDGVSEYQLLLRVLKEQTVRKADGTLRLKTKEDGNSCAENVQKNW